MAVTLSSDLVADVIRAADPARRTAALARLKSLGSSGTDFAAAVDATGTANAPNPAHAEPAGPHPSLGKLANAAEGTSTYQGFERMVLRNLFETLLPNEESGAFGGGPSAGIWRSMAADQLAGVYAAKGGVGIAGMLASARDVHSPQPAAQWPYFSMSDLRLFGSEKKS